MMIFNHSDMKKIATVLAALLLCFVLNAQEGWTERKVEEEKFINTEHTITEYKGEGFTFRYMVFPFSDHSKFFWEFELNREPFIMQYPFQGYSYGDDCCEVRIVAYDKDKTPLEMRWIFLRPDKRVSTILCDPIDDGNEKDKTYYWFDHLLNSHYLRLIIPLKGTREDLDIWISPKQ